YRNQYGQMLEGAPYYHRDIHPPTELNTHREKGEFPVKVRVRGGYQTYVLDYHPFDIVGWARYLYPATSSVPDFDPITDPIRHAPTHRSHRSTAKRHTDSTPSSARSARASSTSPRWPFRFRITTRTCSRRRCSTTSPGTSAHGAAPRGARSRCIPRGSPTARN